MKKHIRNILLSLSAIIGLHLSGLAQITITGKVTTPKQITAGALYQIDFEDSKHKNLGNFKVNEDGSFEIKSKGGGEVYQLHFKGGFVWLALMPGEKIKVVYDDQKNFTVTGSKSTEELRSFEVFYKKWESKLKSKEFNVRLQKFIDKMTTPLAIYGSKTYWNNGDEAYFEKTVKRLQKIDKNCKATKRMVKALERLKKVSVGAIAPEIALQNPEGETVKLSSLRGKYVLVDFWASWCKPCRVENPAIVKAFKKYKSKGFTVYGVSLDQKKTAWVKAIKKDQLDWTHVTDYKFWSTPIVKTYSVGQLPSNFLLDPSGKIIAKSLKGEKLEKKLAEIFAE